MSTLRRGGAVLATACVLSLVLAACSAPATDTLSSNEPTPPSSSDVSPMPEASDAEPDAPLAGGSGGEPVAPPVFTAVTPAPRLPVTCAQLLESLPGLSGGTASPMYVGTFLDAVVRQVGFLRCEMSTQVEGLPVRIKIMVGVDIPRSLVQGRVDAAVAAGHHTNLGADLSYSDCAMASKYWSCSGGIFANGHFAEFTISRGGVATSAYNTAIVQVMESLASRVSSWGPPAAAWRAPVDALRWVTDCPRDVARSDAGIVAAVPFAIGSPTAAVIDDGFVLSAVADERAGLTYCQWSVHPQPTVTIVVLPGASWMFAAPGALTGSPISFPGALAALKTVPVNNSAPVGYSQGSLQLVVHDSLVIIDVASSYDTPSIPTPQLTSIPTDIAHALIAELR